MDARERQLEIVMGMIQRSPVRMTLDAVDQMGESPDTHRYTIGCECGDTFDVTLEQNQEGSWVMQTLSSFRSHVESKHNGQIKSE